MNEIINKFSLAGYEVQPKMHLRQPGFTYIACRSFVENKEKLEKLKGTGDSKHIY